MSGFNQNLEGWVPNVPDAPYLQPRISGATLGRYNTARNGLRYLGTDGNPGGFLRLRDLDGDINRDAVVAPSKVSWRLGCARAAGAHIEFDHAAHDQRRLLARRRGAHRRLRRLRLGGPAPTHSGRITLRPFKKTSGAWLRVSVLSKRSCAPSSALRFRWMRLRVRKPPTSTTSRSSMPP
ncbi:MAG: hypothetical protein R2748_12455 [Bryobacterales bacterium]